MALSHTPTVVGIGEILWDRFGDRRLPGGAPANVAYHAVGLGLRGRIASRVGRDADGDDLLELLVSRGLDVALVGRDAERPTGSVTVDTSDPSAPSYTIHEDVAWDAIPLTTELEAACRDCDALCVGTLAQRSSTSRETIQACLELARDAWTVYDVNLRPPHARREWIEATLERSRAVKLNEGELRWLDDLLELGGRDTTGIARAILKRYGAELVCVTRAERGCLLVESGSVHEEPGVAVEVVDAVGAGDAFTAALIDGLLHERPAARIARDANRLGGAVASRAGAMPDYDQIHHRNG